MPPSPSIPYRRMKGGRTSGPFRASCWLAADHLLCVETSWFVESYRRFGLRDIESLVIQRNDRARVFGLLGGVVLLVGAAMALPPAAGGAVRVIGAILGVPALLALVLNAMRGPCCTVTLQTRVSRQRLRAWGRLRIAQQAAGELAVAIEAVQGPFDEADFAAAGPGVPPVRSKSAPPPAPPLPAPPPAAGMGRRPHMAAALVLLIEAAAAAAAIGVRSAPMLMGTLTLSFLLFGLCVVLLVRGSAARVPRALRIWTWWLFAYVAARGVVAYIWGLGRYLAVTATSREQPNDWVVLLFDSWAADSRFLAVYFGAVCLASAVLGVLGLLLARKGAEAGARKAES